MEATSFDTEKLHNMDSLIVPTSNAEQVTTETPYQVNNQTRNPVLRCERAANKPMGHHPQTGSSPYKTMRLNATNVPCYNEQIYTQEIFINNNEWKDSALLARRTSPKTSRRRPQTESRDSRTNLHGRSVTSAQKPGQEASFEGCSPSSEAIPKYRSYYSNMQHLHVSDVKKTKKVIPMASLFRGGKSLTKTSNRHLKQQEDQMIKIATFNVNNLNANLPAVQKALKFTDVLAVQERWMFNFEQQKIGQLDVAFSCAAKSVDDEDPISLFQCPRGYGGVAILWRKIIDDEENLLPDGSSSIICLELKTNRKKICIISLYMPSRGRPESEADSQDALDEINEIIEKYHHSHSIILMGDLNASLNRESPYPRGKALRSFCISNNICTDTPNVTTFYHSNGRDVSQIDYNILATKEDKEIVSSNEKTPHPDILDQNVSDHESVFGSINIPSVKVNNNNTESRSIDRNQGAKTNWDKIDKEKYKRLLDERITPRLIKSNEDLDHVIQELIDVMISTAKESLLKPDRKAKRSSKGLDIWSPSIINLVKLNKKAHFVWKEAGRPKDTHHPDNARRKNSRRALRSAIRRANRNIKDHHLQEISSARSKDTKLFHKLIKAQRAEATTNFTNLLIINDEKFTDPDEICRGFKDHFCKLADNISTEDLSSIEETASIRIPVIQDLCKNGENATPVDVDEVKKLITSFKNGKSQDHSHITAEHLKYTGGNMLLLLTNIISYMLTSTSIPDELTRGILTPILKKKKDKTRPDNYRGITVTSSGVARLLEMRGARGGLKFSQGGQEWGKNRWSP